MAGFPYQYPVFLLDSVSFPNTSPPKMSGSLEERDFNTPCFSSYAPETFQEVPLTVGIHEANFMGNNTSDNEPSELENCGDQASQKQSPNEKKRITREESSSVSSLSMGVREVKTKKQKKTRNGVEETEEKKNKTGKKDQKKVLEEPPSGYIHVRARRGQATDSHSLAERVRREKISERMKMLQGLVPGCNKVTGKALMLDEIINYVQSLQYQVEFLSMKLASVNPTLYDFGTDLDAFMVTSEKGRSLGSPLQSIHQPNPTTQPTIVSDTTARNNSCIQDNAVTFLLQQQQGQMEMLNSMSSHQDNNGNLYMDVDEQRQRFLNQCSFNNLC